MTSHHTYLKLKALERNGERWLTGVATTPSIDLQGDSVRPEGAVYDLPMPLLAFHSHCDPVGAVTEAHVSHAGIRVRARLSQGVQKAEELWTLVNDGALSAFSIGFIGLKSTPLTTGGVQWDSWRWAECSIVSVPANPDCRFQVGKTAAYATPQPPAKNLQPIKSEGSSVGIDAEKFGRAVGTQIMAALEPMKKRIAALEAQVAGFQPLVERALSFTGEHSLAQDYRKGAVVTHGGKAYVALRHISSGKASPNRDCSGWARLTD